MTHSPRSVESLCAEQRTRWLRGDRVRVEQYLQRHPQLGPDQALDLIYNEIVLRQESGEHPALPEYMQRFGGFEEELRRLFEVHDALEWVPPSGFDAALQHGRLTDTVRTDRCGVSPGFALPGYDLLAEIGRGGMGVVYKALQDRPRRLVAVKMLLGGPRTSPEGLARFQLEASAVARLAHPNVVHLYEVGEHQGQPYFSMELVEGGSLADRLGGSPQPAEAAAQLVATLARAVHAAHERDVIHRDLKPTNVLLAGDGTPKVTDFGLAKQLDAAGQTRTGEVMGTPSYMAPEQAAGRNNEIGPATDVYALGAILYEMLTGRPPFKAETVTDTLLQVLHQDPVPPSRLRARTPRDLETICLKCLHKEPAQRYASAAALADDLQRFLDGRPVQARPLSVSRRVLKWARRRPGLAATLVFGLVTLLGLGSGMAWYQVSRQRFREQLRAEVRTSLGKARQSYLEGEWTAAGSYLDEVLVRAEAEPSLRELGEEARSLLADVQTRLRHQADVQFVLRTEQALQLCCDEALFHGMNSLAEQQSFTGLDPAAHRRAAAEAARKGLRLVGLGGPAAPDWQLDPRFTGPPRRAGIVDRCCTLLLILADAVATRGRPGQHEALDLLDQAARLRPLTRAYHRRRARRLQELGDPAGAARERQAAQQLSPGQALDQFLLGEALYRRGDLAGAVGELESAITLEPGHFWAQCYLGACHLRLRQWHRAASCFTVCLVRRPDFPWARLMHALASLEHGGLRAAETDLAAAEEMLQTRIDPLARYGLLVHRGALRLRQGRLELAAADFRTATALQPGEYVPWVNLARAFRMQHKPAEADQALRRAARLNPPSFVLAEADAEQGAALYREGRYEKAIAACREALRQQPDHTFARGVLAQALLRQKRYREAAREFDRYLADGGTVVADVFRGRGAARVQLGDYLGARDDYTHALQLQPGAELYAHRGWAYFFADAWRPALRDFDAAVRMEPSRGDAWVGRGLARVMLGRYREAVADAERALRQKPAAPEMMHNLACLFAQALARVRGDTAAADRSALAASYQERCLEAIRKTLALLPEKDQPAFWRDKVLPDVALAPVHGCPAFARLREKYDPPN